MRFRGALGCAECRQVHVAEYDRGRQGIYRHAQGADHRMRILGVSIVGDAQLVFIDTLVSSRRSAAWTAHGGCCGRASDLTYSLLIDAKTGIDRDTRRIINGLKERTARRSAF